jgi:acetyl-CoA carboxylase biotin carboxyl carrier protein
MDTEKIKELVELMVDHDLSRIEIEEGETHILLKRGPSIIHTQMAAPQAAAPAPAHVAATPAPVGGAPAPAIAPVEAAANELLIRSPMVGTFYSAPDPESPAFVSVGDSVSGETLSAWSRR